ncbi:DUF2637 domain-containing protein [Kitasatospora purpeofusca]|uniref:DUF2637 domain-containing protein n=1 Tax=Kitasatospora purpeofusca TaxID=67352 RepID=UPI0035E17507
MATLTPGMRRLVKASAAGGAVIAGIGFWGSYKALEKLARVQGEMGDFAYAFPIGIDVGIAVLLALDLVLTWLRIRFPLLRYTAWLMTAATIVFNAASAWPKLLPMALHAGMPMLFIVVVEAGRYAIARIAAIEAGKPDMEGVRFFRWFLSPAPTFRLWRRMKLWEITSYSEIVDLEQRRLVYRTILRHKYGRRWRSKAPVAEMLPLKLARYGRSLPYLEPPETDLTREYAPRITVERTDRPAPAAAAELPAALPPELLQRLDALLEREPSRPEPRPAVDTRPEPVAPVLNKGLGMVPLVTRQPADAVLPPSSWFGGPQQPDTPAAPNGDLAHAGAIDRPQPAAALRQEVRVRIPQQPETIAEQPPAPEPEPEPELVFWADPVPELPFAFPAEPVAEQLHAPEPEPIPVLEPEPTPEPEPVLEPVLEPEPVLELPTEETVDTGFDETVPPVDGPQLTSKQQLELLYPQLAEEDRALSAVKLAEKLAPKIGASEGSTRVYINKLRAALARGQETDGPAGTG